MNGSSSAGLGGLKQRTAFILVLGFAAALLLAGRPTAASDTRDTAVAAAFQKFWSAKSTAEAAKATEDIVKSGVSFEGAVALLRAGRRYDLQPSGVTWLTNKTRDGVERYFSVNIPDGYDPARRYQVRFQLHGGVGGLQNNQPPDDGRIGPLAGAEQIYVLPYAWKDAPWWSDEQIVNFATILDLLKRRYNVDENRVVVSGVSDGGTATYFIAMRETTSFASFLPLNGFIGVLTNRGVDDGQNYPNNLRNKPVFAVNGGRDYLYPTFIVGAYTQQLTRSGVSIDYRVQKNADHDTQWWPQIKGPFEDFVAAHPRNPYPDSLTWTAAVRSPYNRAHWLVIDEWRERGAEPAVLPDVNNAPDESTLFSKNKPSGRVDLVRKGNSVEAVSEGVASFTLLLSPDVFDFGKPVTVIVNGETAFEGRVDPSLKTLLKWAARDNDRTMLFGAELKIKVPKKS